MRLIRGETLEQAIHQLHYAPANGPAATGHARRVQLRRLLDRYIAACKTIAYAHTRGIVHRDIKPQNIMLGKYGETLVVDWGLAMPFQREERFRVADEKTLLPKTGDAAAGDSVLAEGTPVYMSPEQASGRGPIGPHSDIFSLGITLYQILTGRLPFNGNNALEVKRNIVAGTFTPAHKTDRTVPRPLSAVCGKAMAGDPARRYATALELAGDVENYLVGDPVSAASETLLDRLRRRFRRV
jgi:serine/threonine-protein kinase